MSVTTTVTTAAPAEQFSRPSASICPSITTSQGRRPVWRVGLVAGAIASAANSAFAAVVHQFGVSLTIAGEQVPIAGFAQLTMVGALLGIALAAVLARRSSAPRTWFVRVTVALTTLSLVPDVIVDADLASRFTLGLTHLIAAAIVVPVIARRLSR